MSARYVDTLELAIKKNAIWKTSQENIKAMFWSKICNQAKLTAIHHQNQEET